MMWNDAPSSAPSNSPSGTTLSSQTTGAASLSDMSMASPTTKPISALSEMGGMAMSGMSMETASVTGMAGMQMGGVEGRRVGGVGMVMGVLGAAVLVV